jgi:hypothetical protein
MGRVSENTKRKREHLAKAREACKRKRQTQQLWYQLLQQQQEQQEHGLAPPVVQLPCPPGASGHGSTPTTLPLLTAAAEGPTVPAHPSANPERAPPAQQQQPQPHPTPPGYITIPVPGLRSNQQQAATAALTAMAAELVKGGRVQLSAEEAQQAVKQAVTSKRKQTTSTKQTSTALAAVRRSSRRPAVVSVSILTSPLQAAVTQSVVSSSPCVCV